MSNRWEKSVMRKIKEWLGWLFPMPPYSMHGMCPADCSSSSFFWHEALLVISGNRRRKGVTWVLWSLVRYWFWCDTVGRSSTWQLPPAEAAWGFLLRHSMPRSTWCQGKAYGWGRSARLAAPETKAWLLQTLPQNMCFSYIYKLWREGGKSRRGAFALVFLMKYNQSREHILCFQPDIPSMCLAR